MRTSLIALGFLTVALAHCSGDRGLFVGEERGDAGGGGEAGDPNGTGGAGASMTGGNGGTSSGGTGSGAEAGEPSNGGTSNGGTSNGGTGSGAEAGEPATGGTGTAARGGTDAGGSGGDAGSATAARGGMAGSGAEAGSGTAARGGMNDGGRAGSNNAGAGGTTDVNCNALEREYAERLASAQQCSTILTVEQCTVEVPDDAFCGCPTFANPERASDIQRLREIIEKARACLRICPAIACPDVKRGTCAVVATIIAPGRGLCAGLTM